MSAGYWIFAGSLLLVLAEGVSSYFITRNFFPRQLMERWGRPGIAFFAHGGMWGDLLVLPPLFASIAARHGGSWNIEESGIMAGVGLLGAAANHVLLVRTQEVPDPLGWKEEWFSIPIVLHFFYMAAYVALVGLFYFCSPDVSVLEAAVVSIILGLHVGFGTHIPLGIANLWMKWEWCPTTFLHSGALALNCALWLILSALAWYAGGFAAAKLVLIAFVLVAGGLKLLLRAAPTRRYHGR